MRVLYVCHTSRVSGAERSLLDLIMTLGDRVDAVLACPNGELSQRARAAGMKDGATRSARGRLRLGPAAARGRGKNDDSRSCKDQHHSPGSSRSTSFMQRPRAPGLSRAPPRCSAETDP